MCDERTVADDVAGGRLTRRQFAAAGTAVMLGGATSPGLTERMVEVTTPDGKANAFLVHPAAGRHPGVLHWPDILGLREANKAMARQLAGRGFAVLVVNPYYRQVRAPLGIDFAAFRAPGGRDRLAPYIAALTPDAVARDGAAHVAFLDGQAGVDRTRGIGVQGYCMSGPFAIRTAAAASARVKAAASFHGGGLVTEAPDSPHRLLGRTQARYLIAIARNDDARAPGDKEALRTAAAAAHRPAEIAVYPADHGWCVPDAPAYDPVAAERAFARLQALYATL